MPLLRGRQPSEAVTRSNVDTTNGSILWDNSACIHDVSLALTYANVCQFRNFPGSNMIAFCAHLNASRPLPAIATNGSVSFISVMFSSERWISRIACAVRRSPCCKINEARSRRSCTFDGSACSAFCAILVACSTSPCGLCVSNYWNPVSGSPCLAEMVLHQKVRNVSSRIQLLPTLDGKRLYLGQGGIYKTFVLCKDAHSR